MLNHPIETKGATWESPEKKGITPTSLKCRQKKGVEIEKLK